MASLGFFGGGAVDLASDSDSDSDSCDDDVGAPPPALSPGAEDDDEEKRASRERSHRLGVEGTTREAEEGLSGAEDDADATAHEEEEEEEDDYDDDDAGFDPGDPLLTGEREVTTAHPPAGIGMMARQTAARERSSVTMTMTMTASSSSPLLSMEDAMGATAGAAASFTAAGAALGSAARTGRTMSEHARRVAEGDQGAGRGYYSGTLGAKGVGMANRAGAGPGEGGALVAAIGSDVQRSREVSARVAARLNGVQGRGLAQLTQRTGARVHIENLAGLREVDEHPRRVMVVGGAGSFPSKTNDDESFNKAHL